MTADAGYSGTPLPKKLGISAGTRVLLANAPPGFTKTLGELPPDVETETDSAKGARFDVIVAFCPLRASLQKGFSRWKAALARDGGLWIAWPKRTSGVATDLTEAMVREAGLVGGLVDNKVCAIDATWSGLRFVRRTADRQRST
jgi:hypothetical protein